MNSKVRKGTPIDTRSKEATQIQNLKDDQTPKLKKPQRKIGDRYHETGVEQMGNEVSSPYLGVPKTPT